MKSVEIIKSKILIYILRIGKEYVNLETSAVVNNH